MFKIFSKFFTTLFLMVACSVYAAPGAVRIASEPEAIAAQKRIVDTFLELRLQYSVSAACKFLERQKPRDVLACLVALTNQLDSKPASLGKELWDKLLRGLETYAAFLDRLYVASEDVTVVALTKPSQKPPAESENFYLWWKKVDIDSYTHFGGIYFDYHLVGIRAAVLAAWDLVDPAMLYDDPSVELSLKALRNSVTKFSGIPRFHGYYERMTKKAAEFVVAMRKRISQRKWQSEDGPVVFQSAASIPRTPAAYGLIGKEVTATPVGAFCESFLSSYGICLHERYGHEYHEYLLNQTAESYDQLEKTLGNSGMKLDGRIMIMGYEGGAFDSYFSNFNDLLGDALCDEIAFKGNAGFSKPPANYFGFLTGFALRDANAVSSNGLFEHIHDERVELFPRVFDLLQRDSFTQLYSVVKAHEDAARSSMQEGNVNRVLQGFVSFFDYLYDQNLMLSDGQNVATQDILFNRKHIQHLMKSDIPTIKFYTGPDITYSINPTKQRNSFATNHAQDFVKRFVKHLVPRGNEPTVYIFNSFVDGVGKSTTLGNIKNWIKYGNDMAKYETTDNTSSQLADIFEFAPGVFIADLPAQISHFTYKPDGYVFVDVASVKGLEDVGTDVLDHFVAHEKEIVAEYGARIERVGGVIAKDGWYAPVLNQVTNPFDAFAKNLHLLKLVKSNVWIPCEFNGKFYLVNGANHGEVRVFISLPEGESSGLKNVRADQIFFFDGIKLPLLYQTFLDDLTSRCLAKGVKKVCFVDFLSMYMRSSRENVRVNYLMQQMALLFSDFDQKDTVYRDLTGNAELLHCLDQKDWYARAQKNLERESLVRWGFNSLLEEWKSKTLRKVSLQESTERVTSLLTDFSSDFKASVSEAVSKKLALSTQYLRATCGNTKEFINIQSISWDEILDFAKTLERVMSTKVADRTLKSLWSNFGGEVQEPAEGVLLGECNRLAKTAGGKSVRVRFVVDPDDRNSIALKPVVRILRTIWYNTIFQFIESSAREDGLLRLANPMPLLPWSVRKGANGLIYIVQPNVPVINDQVPEEAIQNNEVVSQFVDLKTTQWACVNNKYFAMDLKELNTSVREYAFGCEEKNASEVLPPMASLRLTTRIVADHIRKVGLDDVLSMSSATEELQRILNNTDGVVKYFYADVKKMLAIGNRIHMANKQHQDVDQEDAEAKGSLRNLDPEEYMGAELFMGFAVKLEQTMRDPDSTIVVRKGNKEDVAGALKFLEMVILPQYFGVVSDKSLAKSKNIHKFLFS